MSQKINLLSFTKPTAASSGITINMGVVMDGTTRGNVKKPASTPEKTFVGVAIESVDPQNNVALQSEGIAIMLSDGSAVINPGDYLILADSSGRVKSQAIAIPLGTGSGAAMLQANWNVYNIVGMCVDNAQIPATANAVVSVKLQPFVVSAA